MSGRSILFLDQTGAPGGGELALRDVVQPYRDGGRVALFADGPFRSMLEADGLAVTVLDGGDTGAGGDTDTGGDRAGRALAVRRESGPLRALAAGPAVLALVGQVAALARGHDLIYANSQKASLVGALASRRTGVPLVVHLHDLLIPAHFRSLHRRVSVVAANRARRVIADSAATGAAFVAAGGRADRVDVVHYGFPVPPPVGPVRLASLRAELGIDQNAFVVAHVGRLSPWKGQDVFLRALARVPEANGLIVGEPLFGEDELTHSLPELAAQLGVADRVVFTGFRSDVADLLQASDLLVHSSTSPEPFGRVIVEGMVAGVPVVAARAGGPLEIIDDGRTGWLTEPGDVGALADRIQRALADPAGRRTVARAGAASAGRRFTLEAMHAGIAESIERAIGLATAGESR